MAILKVAQLGHPVLREVAREVSAEEFGSLEFQTFLDDLVETMDEYDGLGLAAPQVHVPLRVAVLTLTEDRGPEFFVNPRVTVLSDTVRRTWEGCLSVEGMRGLVERPDHIRVEAFDRDGVHKVLEVRGFGAVVLQHEFDHLDGVIYVDRAIPRSLVFVREYRRFGAPEEFADSDADDEDDRSVDEDDLIDGDTYDEPMEAEA